jgi:hypothetical protein
LEDVMNNEERINRILVRGEFTDHSHVVTGEAEVNRNDSGEIIITVGNEGAVLRHLLESKWMEGVEVKTDEHEDIDLDEGVYTYIPQQEFDPFEKIIRRVVD